jgi:hypothetical protein
MKKNWCCNGLAKNNGSYVKKKKKYMKSSHQGQLLKSKKYIEKVHIK